MNNDIIKLEQLPIIKYQLEQISVQIKEKVDQATSLICNEDTIQEVKKVRADLNKEFNELETKRKEVKKAITQKYDEFEEIYKENVVNIYKEADACLKEKIDNVESELKKEKENNIREFFEEHQKANHLENIINFENVGLNVKKNDSIKSLKEQIKTFCEKVANDIKAMQTDENKEEIYLEYRTNGFDYAKAKTTVAEKKKAIEEFKLKMTKNSEEVKQEEVVIQNVETLVSAPVEVKEEEPIQEFEFKVKMTLTQAKELKAWLKERNIEIC